MKRLLLLVALLLCAIPQARAEEPGLRLALHAESLRHGKAASLDLLVGGEVFYGGLSFNRIDSSRVIQHGNRTTIYPVYALIGLKAPWPVSPFVEGGFDLGDSLFEDLYSHGDDEDELVDYYYAGGLVFAATDTLSFSVYAKRYNFMFRETFVSPTEKYRPESYGAGMIVRF